MTKEIETTRVSIDVLSVSIRVLHIDRKQMTLAVFRQLPTVDLYQSTGDLTADFTLWGTVRYLVDDCNRWAVGTRDGILWRGVVRLPYEFAASPQACAAAGASARAVLAAFRQYAPAYRVYEAEERRRRAENDELERTCPIPYQYGATNQARYAWIAAHQTIPLPRVPPNRPEVLGYNQGFTPDDEAALIHQVQRAIVDQANAERARRTFAQLEALPQLFIAV